MVLKVHYVEDSEIMSYEYLQDSGNTSEFRSDSDDEDEHEVKTR